MNTSDIFRNSRVHHVRELKAENSRLKADLAAARESLAMWEAHFPLAVRACLDAEAIQEGGRLVVVDGWNYLLHTGTRTLDALLALSRKYLAVHGLDRIWIAMDGPKAAAIEEVRLRVNYTGGEGLHRADRLVLDFLRALRLSGRAARVAVVTGDRDFIQEAVRLGAEGWSRDEFAHLC